MACTKVKLFSGVICATLLGLFIYMFFARCCQSGFRAECENMDDPRLKSIARIRTLLPDKATNIALEYSPPDLIFSRLGGFARGRCKVTVDDLRTFLMDQGLEFEKIESEDFSPPGIGPVWCSFNEAELVIRDGARHYKTVMPNGAVWYSPVEDGPVYKPCPRDGLCYSKIADNGAGVSYFYDVREGFLYFNWTSN